MATHSSILAWRISWTEESGGLQSMESQRVGQDWATNTLLQFLEMCKDGTSRLLSEHWRKLGSSELPGGAGRQRAKGNKSYSLKEERRWNLRSGARASTEPEPWYLSPGLEHGCSQPLLSAQKLVFISLQRAPPLSFSACGFPVGLITPIPRMTLKYILQINLGDIFKINYFNWRIIMVLWWSLPYISMNRP